MKLSKALEGFILAKGADGPSPKTLESYRWAISKLIVFLDDCDIEKIETTDLQRFFIYMRDEYRPIGIRGGERKVAYGTMYSIWRAVKSQWHWAHDVLGIPRVDTIKAPEGQYPVIVPFTEDEIRSLLRAAERITVKGQHGYTRKTLKPDRNVALLMLMLDTGLRVGEVERLTVNDVNPSSGEVVVQPHGTAKKTHGRTVYMGKTARRSLWKYLSGQETYPGDPLFLSDDGRALNQNAIRTLIREIALRAEVKKAHPHKFRHTFAIQFLRNGGNVFALQKMLGHGNLEMCRKYLALVEDDLKTAMQTSSPADRWRL